MKDHQLGYTLPLQTLGAKIERHQATPEDRRAMELCKFEQKRHEVEPTRPKVHGGWIVRYFDDDEFPLDGETIVEVMFHCGETGGAPKEAASWSWHGGGTPYSIVAYRVVL